MSGEEDRTEILAHFQEITGLTDTDQCYRLLNAHEWNLEAAVQDALNVQEGGRPVYSEPTPPPPLPRQPSPQLRTAGRTNRIIARQPQGWWEWLMNLAFLPVRLVISTATEILNLCTSIIFGHQPAPALNPVADVNRFIDQFEMTYGTTRPPFLQCSYSDALNHAKHELTFLLVYIHSSGHHNTDRFCREVLCSPDLHALLASSNISVWGVGVDTEEGARVSYILRETTYPFLAMVMLKGSRMTTIGRIDGFISLPSLLEKLQLLVAANEPELIVLRSEREQRSMDQELRRQQDEEFRRSLEADREKERRRLQEQELADRVAEEERQRELSMQRLEEEFEREKERRSLRLPPEPSLADHSTTVHINLKMPDGVRLERKFQDTDKLESIYDLAYTYDNVPKKFVLLTNFPRRELVCEPDGGPCLKDLDLGRKCLLFLQDMSD